MTATTTKRQPATQMREQFLKLLIATGKTSVSRQEVKDIARSSGIRTTVVSWFVRNPENRATRGLYAVPADTSMALVDASVANIVSAPKTKTTTKVAKVATTKPVKTKTAKVKSSKTEKVVVEEFAENTKPIDVLDAIDTDVLDFEDREYAESFVKTL